VDVASLIQRLSTGSYTVTHRAAPTTDGHGRTVAGAATTETAVAAVYPASGRDLLRLPEGRRSTETRVVITTTALTTGAQGGVNADQVTLDGLLWEVQNCEPWQTPGATGTGYKALVQVPG
jgi:hypothetical protein